MADDAVMPDLEIHATGEVQNPSNAVERMIAELTMWRNLAHEASILLTRKGWSGHEAWQERYRKALRG